MREMKDSAISLIAIVRYHFFFHLTNFLPLLFQWIADNNIQQQSFRSRNTRQLFNFFSSNQPRIHEPKPSLSAARTIWEAAMPTSIRGKCLSFTLPPKREVILADSSTIRICTGASFKLIHTKPGSSLPYFAGKFSVRNHHKLPRLCIAS